MIFLGKLGTKFSRCRFWIKVRKLKFDWKKNCRNVVTLCEVCEGGRGRSARRGLEVIQMEFHEIKVRPRPPRRFISTVISETSHARASSSSSAAPPPPPMQPPTKVSSLVKKTKLMHSGEGESTYAMTRRPSFTRSLNLKSHGLGSGRSDCAALQCAWTGCVTSISAMR